VPKSKNESEVPLESDVNRLALIDYDVETIWTRWV